MHQKEEILKENRTTPMDSESKKTQVCSCIAFCRKTKMKVETSRLGNLKIIPRNLYSIVLSWIPSLDSSNSASRKVSYKQLFPIADFSSAMLEKNLVRRNTLVCFLSLVKTVDGGSWTVSYYKKISPLKVHKIENFFDSDFEICFISLLVMHK